MLGEWAVKVTPNIRFSSQGDCDAGDCINEYEIRELLGQGSFGVVRSCLRVINRRPYRKFAMKILSKNRLRKMKQTIRRSDGQLQFITGVQKLDSEISIMKTLLHENIVLLYEVINDAREDSIVLILEYMERGSVMRYDSRERRYKCNEVQPPGPAPEALSRIFFLDLIRGLSYLHSLRICHRDIKPDNLLFSYDRNKDRLVLRISDFGCAVQFPPENALGMVSDTSGTPSFWCPESLSLPDEDYPQPTTASTPIKPLLSSRRLRVADALQNADAQNTSIPTGMTPRGSFISNQATDGTEISRLLSRSRSETPRIASIDCKEGANDITRGLARSRSASDKVEPILGRHRLGSSVQTGSSVDVLGEASAQSWGAVPVEDESVTTFSAFAADRWAAGVTLYCLFFGVPPFHPDVDAFGALLRLIILAEPGCCAEDGGESHRPSVCISDPAHEVLHGLLRKDPSTRMELEEVLDSVWMRDWSPIGVEPVTEFKPEGRYLKLI